MIIFGATRTLTQSKLLPALFSLCHDDHFRSPIAVVGVGRREKSDAQFRDALREAARSHGRVRPRADEARIALPGSFSTTRLTSPWRRLSEAIIAYLACIQQP